MNRTLIRKDENEAYYTASGWDKQKEALQGVIDLYNATGLPALEPGELHRLFNDTTIFLFDKLTGNEPVSIAIGSGGKKNYLPLNKEAALAILQKPEGYALLETAIKNFSGSVIKGIPMQGERYASFQISNIAKTFVIDEAGSLQFSERIQKEIDEAGCYYIKSEAGNSLFQFANDIAASYYANGINKVCKMQQEEWITLLRQVVEGMDDSNKSVVFHTEFADKDRELFERESSYKA